MNKNDLHFMRLALELAGKGRGRTSPNPCVGAVIVNDGRIVGQGYHLQAGTPHAEVHAIAAADGRTAGATLYVTLEPCNHTGRTPPCTEAILQAGIARVVVGMKDPNPSVAGGGCALLAEKGVAVAAGILEEECRDLNRPFIKHSASGMPWVVMKAGMSLDARISYRLGQGGRITGVRAGRITHQLRNWLDGVLIGIDTAIIDNPSLTCRLEEKSARDPLRIILDTHLRLPPGSKLLRQQSDSPTWIFCGPDAPAGNERILAGAGAVIHKVRTGRNNRLDLREVLTILGRADITSVLVEGGAGIHASMLAQNLVDEVYLFIAPFFIGDQGPSLLSGFSHGEGNGHKRLRNVEVLQLGEDAMVHGIMADSGS
ncbi:MAG: bifunctional diaminohydroxyphosphoribosylaminopyrimidine deaminase/5-amino-6-(5-phosphoribosylamino)uracil reductase RibD [Desulfobulbaceae bacterium]|nr:bifunctional diaminohydroxyphosphoribosylaminopyrimidine deaminase/5-amino-6-(5-phosphoribosylamino)uracil reductase RibD [Desulfobulbaceae bacterium]